MGKLIERYEEFIAVAKWKIVNFENTCAVAQQDCSLWISTDSSKF